MSPRDCDLALPSPTASTKLLPWPNSGQEAQDFGMPAISTQAISQAAHLYFEQVRRPARTLGGRGNRSDRQGELLLFESRDQSAYVA